MSINNIIFLDIDGVLNSIEKTVKKYNYLKAQGRLNQRRTPEICTTYPDKELVDNLKYIIKETNAKLVISSTWRYTGLESMKRLFTNLGFEADVVIGITGRFSGKQRGYEIKSWIEETRDKLGDYNYVIIDDDSDMDELMDKLVQTLSQTGLTKEKADEVVRFLQGDN